ncbi:MAG: hypothetical protein BHV59_04020 [Bifidobacterium sp. 56_9_plus]|nr:MAG: hypothetical protein BHV59_04020 [Bifidobacterium sp. 56_9_plus]
MVRGNRHAHRNGTHHQHPPDHAHRRQHPQQAASVKAYAATIANTTDTAIQESKRQAKLYNARLANQTSNQTDDEPATQNPDEYNRQLVIPPSDVMATINYPKLGISLPIRHGTSEQTLAIGAGHWEGTSLPIGGAGTHTVITAHRGLADKLMFTKLDQAREGDEFTITTLGETLTYQVQTIRTITPDDFTWINKHEQTRRQRRSGHPYDLHPIRHQHPPASHHRNARPQPRRMPARNRMPHRRNPLHHGIRAHSHLGDPHHTRTA